MACSTLRDRLLRTPRVKKRLCSSRPLPVSSPSFPSLFVSLNAHSQVNTVYPPFGTFVDNLPDFRTLTLGPHETHAGSGKTTTAIAIVQRLASLNHKRLTYVSFTKSAVGDAKRRFDTSIVNCNVNCRTLNSLAWNVAIGNGEDVPEADAYPAAQIDEGALEDLIRTSICSTEITSFLMGVSGQDLARETKGVARFIYKTFESFCKGPLPVHQGFNPEQFGTCYYPAVLYHKGKARSLAQGVPQWQNIPKNIEPFYVGCAKKVRRPFESPPPPSRCCHHSPVSPATISSQLYHLLLPSLATNTTTAVNFCCPLSPPM